jgi:ubiquinone/menaquinone biosynthesis C-methylase UbiE
MPLAIRRKVLSEMIRVTRPGGSIVIADYALPSNRFSKFLVYRLVQLYKAPYYSDFVQSDLQELLTQAGIEIQDECSVLLGAGRIVKGTRVAATLLKQWSFQL